MSRTWSLRAKGTLFIEQHQAMMKKGQFKKKQDYMKMKNMNTALSNDPAAQRKRAEKWK